MEYYNNKKLEESKNKKIYCNLESLFTGYLISKEKEMYKYFVCSARNVLSLTDLLVNLFLINQLFLFMFCKLMNWQMTDLFYAWKTIDLYECV